MIAARWEASDFCISLDASAWEKHAASAAQWAMDRVCRVDCEAPGFCLADLGEFCSSMQLRAAMVDLKARLEKLIFARERRGLVYFSLGRFDQQTTTKHHRDGGPDQSLLMLGYEPTTIRAELEISDYSRCALDLGIDPRAYLEMRNPMFVGNAGLLEPYVTRVECFSHRRSQVVLINNSCTANAPDGVSWQGVLHQATVIAPDPAVRRVVNSMMLAAAALDAPETLDAPKIHSFLTTTTVHRRGYDKPEFEDDA